MDGMKNSDWSKTLVAVFHDSNCQDCLFDQPTVQEGHDLGVSAESMGREGGVFRVSFALQTPTIPQKATSNLQAAGRENFIFFHCPLDGVRFRPATAFRLLV